MRSMTGYGRRQASLDGREITVEVKTVNHRFLDVSVRLPRALSFAEDAVRKQLAETLRRGHADVTVAYENRRADAREVRVDEALARQYAAALKKLQAATGAQADCGLSFIAAQPDVLSVAVCQEDEAAVLSLLREALASALSDVTAMREKEGAALEKDLSLHLDLLAGLRDQIAALAPGVPRQYQEKLRQRLAEMGVPPLDEQRLAQETALVADRCAIDEELARLLSHIQQMRDTLRETGETGRRLDFLIQELNREANTIGSKASDAEITKLVVAAKSEIEKMREQVQNAE